MRYGFRRVTMEDLATAAGISKPTLYSLFPNKQEGFRAAATRSTWPSRQAAWISSPTEDLCWELALAG